MKPGRENAAGIHIGAGLSGYVASLTQAALCAEYGLPNELHDIIWTVCTVPDAPLNGMLWRDAGGHQAG